MNKQLCPTHHFFYSGDKCPLCEKERIEGYASKYGKYAKAPKETNEKKERSVTQEDLDMLVQKFGKKKS